MKTNSSNLPLQRAHPRGASGTFINAGGVLRRWLAAGAALALLLGASRAQAYIFLNDGGTHTINDATYQNDTILVQNGTTLIIESGAVLGGAANYSGQVYADDTSRVTINGGTFGGQGDASGQVWARQNSTVTINGGTFGGSGTPAGAVYAMDSSTVTISGGTFGGTGSYSGSITARYNSTVTINGGTFGGPGVDSGRIGVSESSTTTFRVSSYDTTLYNSTAGGILGVTFCSQSPQEVLVGIVGGTVNLQSISCQSVCDTPVAAITGPASGSVDAVNTPVTFTGTFTGANGPHTAVWTIGGTDVAGTVDENAQTVTATVTFAGPGVYPVQLAVANACGNSGSTDTVGDLPAMVVIYDPSAGFVTGGGWINSLAGAAAWDETLTGKASFGFVSRYQKGATVPTGNTEFQFRAGDLNFKSTSYEWLVVSGARAQYKGAGTINGVMGYSFLLTAIDGQASGGASTEKFRMKIWNPATSAIIYDNQMNALDGADPTTVIGGGNIVIHK